MFELDETDAKIITSWNSVFSFIYKGHFTGNVRLPVSMI